MTFPDFFIFFIEKLFFIFYQMLSLGSFGRREPVQTKDMTCLKAKRLNFVLKMHIPIAKFTI